MKIFSRNSRPAEGPSPIPAQKAMQARESGSNCCKRISRKGIRRIRPSSWTAREISVNKSTWRFSIGSTRRLFFAIRDRPLFRPKAFMPYSRRNKQINASLVEYARKKAESVRKLHRTSLPIPHAGGTYPPKPAIPIIGGILTFESDWSPPMGDPLQKSLGGGNELDRLELGCVAAHGYLQYNSSTGKHDVSLGGKPATAFLFKLISQLQFSGTVPMIDIQAYANWLTK